MGTIQLSDNVYSVGVVNPALRVFDIIMTSDYGTTYNAYLIKGEKNVLIDTVHESFLDEYLENVESIVPWKEIDYIVINHTEPDHSGSLQRILQINPDITIIASAAGSKFLKNLTNIDFKNIVAKDGDAIDIGNGELRFIIAPNLHWPDSMFTYYSKQKMVFTCDFLGAHYCESRLMDTQMHYPEKYEPCFKYYYDCIFGPFKSFVLAGLDKLEQLDIETCCTSHGPILTETLKSRMALYREWSTPVAQRERPKVVIAYASAYNYTKQLAYAAKEELEKEFELEIYDLVKEDLAVIAAKIQEADAALIGSCTINRDAVKPIWEVLSSLDAINTAGKAVGVFGSYGWSGEAVGMICERLKGLKCKVAGEGYRVVFRPNEEDLQKMRAYAREVVAQL